MASPIIVVNWDIDKVWYKDISTSIAARHNPLSPEAYHQRFMESDVYKPEDTELWTRTTGRKLKTVGDIADMLTDFFYGLKSGGQDSGYAIPPGRITKEQVIGSKQSLLRGLTMRQVREMADVTQYNPGLQDAVNILRAYRVHQAGFSDGLGPFVLYKMLCLGLDHREATPAVVLADVSETDFEEPMIYRDDVELTGKIRDNFKKAEAMFAHARSLNVPLDKHAAIDDSSSNIPALKKIREAGGLAVGYKVNDVKAFAAAEIPVLKGDDLQAFAEVVLDPEKLSVYCN